MKKKFYGLMFNYEANSEVEEENLGLSLYVVQNLSNFILVNYFKTQKRYVATEANGFQTLRQGLFIKLYSVGVNPRMILYDKDTDMLYRILDMPIEQEFAPNKRNLYELPIELINTSFLRFDKEFIKNKFNEMWGVYNGIVW